MVLANPIRENPHSNLTKYGSRFIICKLLRHNKSPSCVEYGFEHEQESESEPDLGSQDLKRFRKIEKDLKDLKDIKDFESIGETRGPQLPVGAY